MKLDYQTWKERVQAMLVSIGYARTTVICDEKWKWLYEEYYNPFEAINAMEFDGNLKWMKFRYLQIQNDSRYADPLKLWEEIGVIPKSYQPKTEQS